MKKNWFFIIAVSEQVRRSASHIAEFKKVLIELRSFLSPELPYPDEDALADFSRVSR